MRTLNKPDVIEVIEENKNLIYKIVNSYCTDANE